jgi:sugar-specific transcriptional regulator TrmB
MADLAEQLQRLGLTKYESLSYSTLLHFHMNSATILAERAGVPRTKIYMVLDALQEKGWIKVYSGAPLLFKATPPADVIERLRQEQGDFLQSVQQSLEEENKMMKDKFIILKMDIGIETLKEEIRNAKTVWISNATTDFIRRIDDAFQEEAEIKVVMFPGEARTENSNIQFRESLIKVVKISQGKELPSMNVVLDEERTFGIMQDPKTKRFIVDEMLYDECSNCFVNFYKLGYENATEM